LNSSDTNPEATTPESNSAETSPARHTPAAQFPSSDQLSVTRSARWHQDEQPLLSLESLREWISRGGLVAYGPRVHQLGSPAPSLVEATLGKKLDAAAELSEGDAARSLLARLIAEGSVVPLNLLGATGGVGTDVPDYVASAAVFSFIFTLRGNKAWKQLPVTAGPVKVSPLALATYEMLVAKVTMSSYDLATQLGKEVTEGAVLRALTELWSQLRVIPVPQVDGSTTLWELSSARFTKQIKAGANAGQPTALSALISLYLGQAVAATEAEIETFLSPLAPRSRVREVVHALLSARQLETLVIDGKTLLHVAGELPAFAAAAVAAPVVNEDGEEPAPASRISKFAAKPGSKIGTGLRSKPAFGSKPSFGRKPAFGSKPSFGAKPAFGDRERRPFKRDDKPAFQKPRFDKPWAEKPSTPPSSEGFAASAESPSEIRPPRREFKPRDEAPRRTFSKPGTFARKREGFAGKPSFDRGEGRPPRREFSAEGRPPRREFNSEGRPPRREFSAEGRPPRRDSAERPAGSGFKRTGASADSYAPRPKPSFGGERGGFAGKPSFGRKPAFGDKPSFGPRPGFQRDRGERSSAEGEAPRKTYRKFDAPRDKKPFGAKPFGAKPFGDRPARTYDKPRGEGTERPRSEGRPSFGSKPSFGGKPAGPGGKKPSSKSGGGFAKTGGPFAKFADGKKPFRKPGPGSSSKKFDKPGGSGKSDGGYRPTKRRAE
jgi:23S rRNA pseudouridine2605 synthase